MTCLIICGGSNLAKVLYFQNICSRKEEVAAMQAEGRSPEGIAQADFSVFEADRDRFWEDFLNGNAEQFGEP